MTLRPRSPTPEQRPKSLSPLPRRRGTSSTSASRDWLDRAETSTSSGRRAVLTAADDVPPQRHGRPAWSADSRRWSRGKGRGSDVRERTTERQRSQSRGRPGAKRWVQKSTYDALWKCTPVRLIPAVEVNPAQASASAAVPAPDDMAKERPVRRFNRSLNLRLRKVLTDAERRAFIAKSEQVREKVDELRVSVRREWTGCPP